MADLVIDRAQPADVAGITTIFNEAITYTAAVWYDEPRTEADMSTWIADRTRAGQPFLVARLDGQVVGFTTYGQFRPWPGYRHSVELSIFVDGGHRRRGIGRQLVTTLLNEARQAGVHVIIAGIEADNEASLELHRRLGFVEVGRMPEVGKKFNRWLTLVLMQRML